MIWIAITAAIAAILAHHLGLTEELAELSVKILRCSKCITFWAVLVALLLSGCKIVTAVALSLTMSYLSFWAGFLLTGLQKLYERIWGKVHKNK